MPMPSADEFIIRGRHYATSEWVDVRCRRGRIKAVAPVDASIKPDGQAGWVAPSLFDLQINGCLGHSFNSAHLTSDAIHQVVAVCRDHGVAGLCPTLVTNSLEALQQALKTIAKACDADSGLARALPAIHLEGPYLSPEDGPRGAHPLGFIRPPNWDEFRRLQDAASGRIRLATLAPEHEGALEFIERLTASSVVVALGHTAAGRSRIRDAIKAGARLSTHLGNGSHAYLPRHDNYFWEQLAADELQASIICDGHHLPPALVRCILRVKTAGRTVLTCDASSLAGLPLGRYREWEQEFEVIADGRIVLPGTSYLAGSSVFTETCVANAMRFGGVGLAEAIDMASSQPRALLGLAPQKLEPGYPADLMLFDWAQGSDLTIVKTLVGS
ncbi:MAG: N-acetylglucosamine-6-phosphate deacetylase [Gemmataceae bacterium]